MINAISGTVSGLRLEHHWQMYNDGSTTAFKASSSNTFTLPKYVDFVVIQLSFAKMESDNAAIGAANNIIPIFGTRAKVNFRMTSRRTHNTTTHGGSSSTVFVKLPVTFDLTGSTNNVMTIGAYTDDSVDGYYIETSSNTTLTSIIMGTAGTAKAKAAIKYEVICHWLTLETS